MEPAGLDGHTVSHQDTLSAHTSRIFSLVASLLGCFDYRLNRSNFCLPEIGSVSRGGRRLPPLRHAILRHLPNPQVSPRGRRGLAQFSVVPMNPWSTPSAPM